MKDLITSQIELIEKINLEIRNTTDEEVLLHLRKVSSKAMEILTTLRYINQ